LTADDASRVLALACMVLAAETGNKIPLDIAYIKRRAYLNHDPDFAQLIASQFIEIVHETGNASSLLAGASGLHANARPETETEAEAEERRKPYGAKAPPPVRAFVRPSIEEVKAYCLERRNTVDAQNLLDHYESNGWKVGRNSMKDWKAAVRTWEKNGVNANGKSKKPNPGDVARDVYEREREYLKRTQ